MSWFRSIRERRELDREATERSKALLEEMVATEPELAQRHDAALEGLIQATEQARKLQAANIRNHYSESLTYAFRGKTA